MQDFTEENKEASFDNNEDKDAQSDGNSSDDTFNKKTAHDSSGELREELVKTAIDFLSIPRVASSSLNKKREFLKSKGLTEYEIQVAFQRVNSPDDSSQSANQLFENSRNLVREESSGWSYFRRFTYSSALISAFCYGSYWLYQKFVEPSLIRYVQDKLGSIEIRLEQLNQAVKKSEKNDKILSETVQSLVKKSVLTSSGIDTINEIKNEMASLKAMISKNSNTSYTGYAITELKNEIAAVKGILLKEMPNARIPSWQMNEKEKPMKSEKSEKESPVENGSKSHSNKKSKS